MIINIVNNYITCRVRSSKEVRVAGAELLKGKIVGGAERGGQKEEGLLHV